MQRAKKRLEGLRFFKTVNVSTAPGSQPDRVVVIVQVDEQSTGEFSVGGGYTRAARTPVRWPRSASPSATSSAAASS